MTPGQMITVTFTTEAMTQPDMLPYVQQRLAMLLGEEIMRHVPTEHTIDQINFYRVTVYVFTADEIKDLLQTIIRMATI